MKKLIPALGAGAALSIVIASGASGAKPSPQQTTPVGPRVPLPVKADDVTILQVFRNGEYHPVKIRLKRFTQKDSDGGTTEIVTPVDPTPAEMESQLPPVDPRFDGVKPAEEILPLPQ